MGLNKVALCRIEHEGTVYSYGDEVSADVEEAHPTAVGYANPSEDEVAAMSKEELVELFGKIQNSGGGAA